MHKGKEALELLSTNIDKMWQPLPSTTLEKILAYVEEIEKHTSHIHAYNRALEEAATVANAYSNCNCGESKCMAEDQCTLERTTAGQIAAAIRNLKST